MPRRLRQVTDLYTTGQVIRLKDGSPLWVQALNPFETDTARSEGQIARARLTLALKEHGSGEQAKVRMYFFDDGIEAARDQVVDAKVALEGVKVIERIQNDPEWTERLEILQRGFDNTAVTPTDEEQELVATIAEQYTAEIGDRLQAERDFQVLQYAAADEEQLWTDYLEWYLDRRGAEVMIAEYRMHQVLFGVRECYGVQQDGVWDHSECGGHEQRVFATVGEVRAGPEDFVKLCLDAVSEIDMTVREAKNSDRQRSSRDSSPLPSELEESTPSTPVETPVAPRGSSSSPSTTPSTSSASSSSPRSSDLLVRSG